MQFGSRLNRVYSRVGRLWKKSGTPSSRFPYVPPEARRISVLGSCASRDAFERPDCPFAVGAYVARTSLATFATPALPTEIIEAVDRLDSSFQQRMVETDCHRRAIETLQQASADLLVLDFIDERFDVGVHRASGAMFTLSNEARRAGLDTFADHVLGAADRFDAFEAGLMLLIDRFGADGIVVNAVDYATHSSDGTKFPKAKYKMARNRAALRRMYALCRSLGLHCVEYPPGCFVGDAQHRWGASPYHYVPDVYDVFIHQIMTRRYILD